MSEPDVSQLLTVDQAIAILDAAEVRPRVMRVLLERAQGMRLAGAIRSDRDYPPFDKSLMDGYAVRCADVAQAPVELKVVDEIAAGRAASVELKPGEAMAIMTGAPLPAGADGVVPVEDAAEGDRVRVLRGTSPGRYIARQGSDCHGGEVVLEAGMKLEAAQLAVAASVGAREVEVFARPRVGVLSTGDEIVAIDQAPAGAQIRNSNSTMLIALLRRLGCEVADMGHVRDDVAAIRQRIETGLEHEVLLVTGGMSMGKYDYVPRILREMGAELRITKLRIKPGKPFVFAVMEGGRFVFGLPGNPVSGFACTLRLASRLLARMSGGEPEPRWIEARLAGDLPPNGPREFYQSGRLIGSVVEPLAWRGSADIYTLARANVLLVRPENQPALQAGSTVKLLEIPT